MNADPRDPLTKLEDIHNMQKWRDIGDGYRWRVEVNWTVGGGFVAVVIGSGGGMLYRKWWPTRARASQDARTNCIKIKNAW